MSQIALPGISKVRISIVSFFLLMALLRLTFFDFYLSQLFGFPVEINALGGGAFNFVNYICFAGLLMVFIHQGPKLSTFWPSLSQYAVLVFLYSINFVLSPYIDSSWFLYQLIFITMAIIVHIFTFKVRAWDDRFFYRRTIWIFWMMIALVAFCTIQILFQYPISYYFSEFNDAFVHSLDDFGIMKQRYGYLLGFLSAYTLYMVRDKYVKVPILLLILFAGFGIRSYMIGMIGALLIFNIGSLKRVFAAAVFTGVAVFLLKDQYFDNLIYDTRFYSYANAWNIINNFPFGVGLGGYPIYTDIFNRQIFADFYSVNAILDYVPSSPESDYVHLFGSLGLALGSLHLLVQARVVWLTLRLKAIARPFEKCILFLFCFMTFFGLGEDSMFTVYFWIFFGLATGVITSLIFRSRQHD